MIVRDESSNLAACLHSARGLFDDIVVVDTGSTDDTREVARSNGARVFDFGWCDDFSAARNESIRHAVGDWIFWLDADDRIPESDREALAALFATLQQDPSGYLMTVFCPAPDGGSMSQLLHLRLFPNRTDVRWQYRVHEQIAGAITAIGAPIHSTDIKIVHTGYLEPAATLAKLARNLRLLDLEAAERPGNGRIALNRAATLVGLSRGAEALIALSFAVPAGAGAARELAWLRAQAYVLEERLSDALDAANAGLQETLGDTSLAFLEAQLQLAMGDLTAAEVSLRSLLTLCENHARFSAADRSIFAFRARHLLSEVMLRCERYEEAREQIQIVVSERPLFGPAWVTLAESYLGSGNQAACGALRVHLQGCRGTEAAVAAVEALQYMARGAAEDACTLLDAATIQWPCTAMLPAVLSSALLASGIRGLRLESALTAALARDPLNPRAWAVRRAAVDNPLFAACARSTTLARNASLLGPRVLRGS